MMHLHVAVQSVGPAKLPAARRVRTLDVRRHHLARGGRVGRDLGKSAAQRRTASATQLARDARGDGNLTRNAQTHGHEVRDAGTVAGTTTHARHDDPRQERGRGRSMQGGPRCSRASSRPARPEQLTARLVPPCRVATECKTRDALQSARRPRNHAISNGTRPSGGPVRLVLPRRAPDASVRHLILGALDVPFRAKCVPSTHEPR